MNKIPCHVCGAPLEYDYDELICPACGNSPEVSACCNEIMEYDPIESSYICGCGRRYYCRLHDRRGGRPG